MKYLSVNDYWYRDITRRNWTRVSVNMETLDSMAKFEERANWIEAQSSPSRYFFQPISGTYWFEDEKDALLFRIAWGN